MFSFFYDTSLFLFALISLPKFLWQWKKHNNSLIQRLGFKLPNIDHGKPVIWIHAVSMGETRAAIPLYELLKANHPNYNIILSSTTQTGHAESKRSMPDAAAHFYLPLDFSWIMRRTLKHFRPTTLILVESDFWFNLLNQAKKQQASIILINGKVSERSCRRFKSFPVLTNRLFSLFDHLYIQSQSYADRFLSMGIDPYKLLVTGNLKLDVTPPSQQSLDLRLNGPILTVGSTHAQEEEWILDAIETIPNLTTLLVPRHPERFDEVAHLLKTKKISFGRYSQKEKLSGKERVILIDAMGILNQCYQSSDIALVGGSFVSHVGGHNIFEPVIVGVPVLFGPHLHSQPDLKDLILTTAAGKEVTIDTLAATVTELLSNKTLHAEYVKNCKTLVSSIQGSSKRTYSSINSLFLSKSLELNSSSR